MLPAVAPLADADRSKAPAWAGVLGRTHGARDRAAVLARRAARDADEADVRDSLERWPHIVTAMTRVVAAYNDGVGRKILSVEEDRAVATRPTMTVAAGGEGAPSLTAAIDGTQICIRTRETNGVIRDTEYRLRRDRSDDETAAYALQRWMEQL
jgi:hypothetical protein